MEHDLSLVTTEYRCGNELLVRLQLGKNLSVRLNDQLSDILDGKVIQKEQFLFKKAYRQDDPKLITRDTFETKLKRFDMSQTAVEQEILEDYAYTDKDGQPGRVQVVMVDRSDTVTATIYFTSARQYENFVCPAWLVRTG